MAEGKKSFVLYCDVLHTVTHLTDKQAGILFKHILKYVNDQNPETSDVAIKLAFEPIKQQLKRDLKKWSNYIDKQRENGKKGGRPKETQKTQAFFDKPKKADNVTVTVNVNDTVTVNTFKNIKANFLNDFKWKEKFCYEKKIQAPALEILMNDFITDIELKEDFKTLKELKSHFTSLFNKNKNGTHQQTLAKVTKLGTSDERLAALKKW